MDKYEYEERYGEKVIYCNRHHMSGIDGCIACDEEELEEGAGLDSPPPPLER